MKLISENLHIISKPIKEALINKDELFVRGLIKRQASTNPDWIDLNIGPAKKGLTGIMSWLTEILQEETNTPISFDTTNAEEIRESLRLAKEPSKCIVNSASADPVRLEAMTNIASEFDTYLIALTLNNEIGIPKTCDTRLELGFEILTKTQEKNIPNEKILFDPLILPIGIDQSQVNEALMTIRMFKESFEPTVLTTVGLSNVSNGVPSNMRNLINQVFLVLAMGAGLDTCIADSFDPELLRIIKVLEKKTAEKAHDNLLINLSNMIDEFGDLYDVNYDKNNENEVAIYKTAEVLLNKKIYSNSYMEI